MGQQDHGGLLVWFKGNTVCELLLVVCWSWDCDIEVGLEVGCGGGRPELVLCVVAEGRLLKFGGWDFDGGRGFHIWYFSDLCATLWILQLDFMSEGGGGNIGDFGVVAEDGAASHLIYLFLSGEVRYRMMWSLLSGQIFQLFDEIVLELFLRFDLDVTDYLKDSFLEWWELNILMRDSFFNFLLLLFSFLLEFDGEGFRFMLDFWNGKVHGNFFSVLVFSKFTFILNANL